MNKTINEITDFLLESLPDIANQIIEKKPENNYFLRNPDDPQEHVANWHQFGIISHTRVVLEAYLKDIPKFYDQWNIGDKINKKLLMKINEKTKHDLIKIGIILHDIGKFARVFKYENGKIDYTFYGHEAISEKLIISEDSYINNLLKNTVNLTVPQIDYIGRIAGLHFELGKSRDAARKSAFGYSIAFSKTNECEKSCLDIASKYPEFKEEIGLLFLVDSLGKTDIRITAENDEQIEKQEGKIHQVLEERKLNPKLISAIKQLPVNIAIAKKYLQII